MFGNLGRIQGSKAFALDWWLLLGYEDNSLIGHLNKSFLGGREEWGIAKLVVGQKAVVTHCSQCNRWFFCFCFYHLDNVFISVC